MVLLSDDKQRWLADIHENTEWNDDDRKELLMHSIHAYPAKFPSFIARKAFEYANDEGVIIERVADVFCGCGTVALESKRCGYDFWGCDINPIATLIAKVKSQSYDEKKLRSIFKRIEQRRLEIVIRNDDYANANERLKYWYTKNSYDELLKILRAINDATPKGKYREVFECIFSSILKSSSRWLTKSIKPQLDKNKAEIDVWTSYQKQFSKFLLALRETEKLDCKIRVTHGNFLEMPRLPKVDLILTSPPYVTSYEYADLHQLSTLWLGFANDYRSLREGSIGSVYSGTNVKRDYDGAYHTAQKIFKELKKKKCPSARTNAIMKYYIDMQETVHRCKRMLRHNGMVFFVIGDTTYCDVKLQNSVHLIESMQWEGYEDIKIGKRVISKGLCVPYRDRKGRFTKDKRMKRIYSEEYIISGRIRQ